MSTTIDAALELNTALTRNPRTQPLIDGAVELDGIGLDITVLRPPEMFLRQLKYAEFDVSEMSLSSLIIATSQAPTNWVALPVFTVRRFFHTEILVRTGAGIESPADLRGKRVGVPEYQQTAALWSRGILKDEFGVDPRDIEWFMERTPDQSHGGATGFTPPEGVTLHYIPAETNIGAMMLDGSLDATLLYISGRNGIDRSQADLKSSAGVRRLFPDVAAEARRYYTKTGIYPINHTVVVRRSLIEQHPEIALRVYRAFVAAKERGVEQRDALLAPYFDAAILDEDVRAALRQDPLAYGVGASRRVLETIARYTYEQGLAKRLVSLDEIFAPTTLGT